MTIEITEHELAELTTGVDEMHHDAMPRFRAELAAWREGALASRRGFLLGLGAAGAAAALAACSSSKSSSSPPPSSSVSQTTTGGSVTSQIAGLTGDLAVAGLAAGLENTAVAVYQAGIDAATAGKLGAAVPPAVVTFAKTAQSHHKDHAAAWNSILTGAGKTAITGGDKTVMDTVVTPALASVTDVASLAKLALELEGVAAATYLAGIDLLTSTGAIQKAISIQPVEMQHVAILNFVLGQYPIPVSFSVKDGARGPTDVIA